MPSGCTFADTSIPGSIEGLRGYKVHNVELVGVPETVAVDPHLYNLFKLIFALILAVSFDLFGIVVNIYLIFV